jgi:TonB family protein
MLPNTRVQRTRSSPSALREPLTRRPLGARTVLLPLSLLLSSGACGQERRGATVPAPAPTPDTVAVARVTPEVYRIGGGITAPVLVTRVGPDFEYPKKGEWELAVLVLEAIVSRDGSVREVHILKKPDGVSPRNVEAALTAIRQWRYKPATLDGQPVEVYLTVTILHVPGRPVA